MQEHFRELQIFGDQKKKQQQQRLKADFIGSKKKSPWSATHSLRRKKIFHEIYEQQILNKLQSVSFPSSYLLLNFVSQEEGAIRTDIPKNRTKLLIGQGGWNAIVTGFFKSRYW